MCSFLPDRMIFEDSRTKFQQTLDRNGVGVQAPPIVKPQHIYTLLMQSLHGVEKSERGDITSRLFLKFVWEAIMNTTVSDLDALK